MTKLAKYPNLASAHARIGGPEGSLADHVKYGSSFLPVLDKAVGQFDLSARPSLAGLVRDLFSEDNSKLLAATHELMAFAWLKRRCGLHEAEIGYPSEWPGDDPPFEGVLRCADEEIAFDVKDGSGSGLWLLTDRLRTLVARFTAPHPPPEVHVAVDAPTGQRWFADNFRTIASALQNDLKMNGSTTRCVTIEAGSGHVKVGIDQEVGGSTMAMAEKASFVASQILDHALEKACKLALTSAKAFALVYVRRPGTGLGDFDEHTFRLALDFLAGDARLPTSLRAVTMIDYCVSWDASSVPAVVAWDRASAFTGHLCLTPDELYTPRPRHMPAAVQQAARDVDPATLVYSGMLLAGPCDLRADGCVARGSVGPVFPYADPSGAQHNACNNCLTAYAWPRPGGDRT